MCRLYIHVPEVFLEQRKYWNSWTKISLLLFQMKSYVWESKGCSIARFYQFWLPNPEFWKLSWYVQRWFRVVTFYIKTFIALDQFKNWYHNWWKGDIRASGDRRSDTHMYYLWWPVFKLIFNDELKKNWTNYSTVSLLWFVQVFFETDAILRNVNRMHDICNKHALVSDSNFSYNFIQYFSIINCLCHSGYGCSYY